MQINVHGEYDTSLWAAADLLGAELIFRGGEDYKVTVLQHGYLVGETRVKRDSREWYGWLRSLWCQTRAG